MLSSRIGSAVHVLVTLRSDHVRRPSLGRVLTQDGRTIKHARPSFCLRLLGRLDTPLSGNAKFAKKRNQFSRQAIYRSPTSLRPHHPRPIMSAALLRGGNHAVARRARRVSPKPSPASAGVFFYRLSALRAFAAESFPTSQPESLRKPHWLTLLRTRDTARTPAPAGLACPPRLQARSVPKWRRREQRAVRSSRRR